MEGTPCSAKGVERTYLSSFMIATPAVQIEIEQVLLATTAFLFGSTAGMVTTALIWQRRIRRIRQHIICAFELGGARKGGLSSSPNDFDA